MNWNHIDQAVDYIHAWADDTFKGRSPEAALTKLTMEEIPELLIHKKVHGTAGIGQELADCFILLFDLAAIWKVDVALAIKAKMEINERRMWNKDESLGHWNHAHPGAHKRKACAVALRGTCEYADDDFCRERCIHCGEPEGDV